jgi:predicted Zn-dependent protease
MPWAEGWSEPAPLLVEADRAARQAARRVPLRAVDQQCVADVQVVRMHAHLGADATWDSSYALAARLGPSDPLILVGWTRARIAAGRPEAALTPARRAVALYPKSGLALLALAEASLAADDTLTARLALDRSGVADWHGDEASRSRAERMWVGLTRASR